MQWSRHVSEEVTRDVSCLLGRSTPPLLLKVMGGRVSMA